MISAEAPVLFAKACEIFILELTLRAWIHTEENKRRTLQVRGAPTCAPGLCLHLRPHASHRTPAQRHCHGDQQERGV